MNIYLYKSDYKVVDGKPIICLFGRDENKKKRIFTIKTFEPYFYVNENEFVPTDDRIVRVESGFINLFGDQVKKIVVKIPTDVRNLREQFEDTWEDDLLFPLRYLIDKEEDLKKRNVHWIGGFNNWRKCYIDIETTTEGGFPDIKVARNPITAITIYDSYDKKYHCFVWRKDLKTEKIEKDNKIIYKFTNEVEMLKLFCRIFSKLQFDIVAGWNIEGFDLPYIIKRLNNLHLYELRLLSPIRIVRNQSAGFGSKYVNPVIKGLAIVDLMRMYKKTHKGELRSFSLRNVGLDELGIDKGIVNAEDEWKKSNINKLIDYNCQDVELTVKLDEKRKLINFINGICDVAMCNFEDVKFYSRVSDVLCLRYAKKHNIVLPSKRKMLDKSQTKYEGALVIANQGLYENVISLDFTSLYPNILKSFNLSLETVDENGDIDCLVIKTSSKNVGIIPSVVDQLINLRKEYKKKSFEVEFGSEEYYIWDAIQQAAKNLYCVLGYGVNALSTFRLYKKEIAESITAIGRELLSQTIKIIEGEGHKVVQGDTDSTYIQLNEKYKSLQEIIDEANRLLGILNKKYNEWCKSKGAINPTIEIKFEKIYKRFLTGTKKRWAGYLLWREGKKDEGIDIAGFNVRRSDSSNFTRSFQREVLRKILTGEPKEEIKKYIKEEKDKFENLKYDYETIGIPTKLNKPIEEYKTNLPVCRGVKWSNENFGTTFREGDKFLMLWCIGEQDVVCYEFSEQIKNSFMKDNIDMNRMVQRSIVMPLKTIFEACKWDEDEMFGRERNSDLMKYVKQEVENGMVIKK